MEIYAILSGKGGTGKTTLAVHLSVAAELSGEKSIVVDLDPQGSATDWGTSRQAETPVVVAADPTRLADILKTAEANVVDVAVIDTAPHTDRDVYTQTPAQITANLASLVIIPCRASIFDLTEVLALYNHIQHRRKK